MDSGNHPFVAVLDDLIRSSAKNLQLKIRGMDVPVVATKLGHSPHPGIYEVSTPGMMNNRPIGVRLLIAVADVVGVFIPEQESERPAIVMPS
jgi:hypothetical protein